jgi:hypothetical protein
MRGGCRAVRVQPHPATPPGTYPRHPFSNWSRLSEVPIRDVYLEAGIRVSGTFWTADDGKLVDEETVSAQLHSATPLTPPS